MADQVFIYFRYTPKGLKLFASRDLSPMGVKKKFILKSDPRAYALDAILNCMIGEAKTHPNKIRPDLEKLVYATHRCCVGLFCEDMIFLPKQGEYSTRVLVKFA